MAPLCECLQSLSMLAGSSSVVPALNCHGDPLQTVDDVLGYASITVVKKVEENVKPLLGISNVGLVACRRLGLDALHFTAEYFKHRHGRW